MLGRAGMAMSPERLAADFRTVTAGAGLNCLTYFGGVGGGIHVHTTGSVVLTTSRIDASKAPLVRTEVLSAGYHPIGGILAVGVGTAVDVTVYCNQCRKRWVAP